MIPILLGTIFGMFAGAYWGVEVAFAGAVLGMLGGLTWFGGSWLWLHSGNEPVVRHHRMICTPNGAFAEIDMVGDRGRNRWVSIQKCSLRDPQTDISCARTCLRMLNDSHVRPGKGCDCQH